MPDQEATPAVTQALVFAAGDMPPQRVTTTVIQRVKAGRGYVVAADGGLAHAAALGLTPDLIVGDLDSASDSLLAGYPSELVVRHPVAKDEMDLELALTAAVSAGASSVSVLGAFGGRLDHSLAALLVAARLTSEGQRVDLHGATHSAWPLAADGSVALELPVGTTLSILSLAERSMVTSDGLDYPLARLGLPFGSGLGVSNTTALPNVSITCDSGLVAVLVEHGEPLRSR